MDPDAWKLERAKIAMEEYKVLHAEILQRNTTLNQVFAGAVAAIVALIVAWGSKHIGPKTTAELIVLIIVVVLAAWRLVHLDAVKASNRIAEIEEYVNDITGGDNENPLSWERRSGLPARGYWDRVKGR